jgi:hypothetical protein
VNETFGGMILGLHQKILLFSAKPWVDASLARVGEPLDDFDLFYTGMRMYY